MTAALCVFVASFAVCAYVYFGYPALLFLLSRMRPRPIARGRATPAVSLIVPVHNEEAVVEAKIRNCLALAYPADLLEILVVSDGSTDGTEAIAAGHEGPGLRVLRLPRQGKAGALNEGARQARGEILVFTDANAMLEPDSVQRLVEGFADPAVGGACGNKKQRALGRADATEGGEDLYWRYDKWQKSMESDLGSIFAADGALYAVRRALYVPIVDPAQADDIAISARVVLQGFRLIFEPRAVAWEEAPVEGRHEFRRKVRVTNHSVRALLNLGPALWSSGFYSVELISHKLLRHLVPVFLIGLLASNLALAAWMRSFAVLLGLQTAFYAAALVGFAARRTSPGRSRLLTIPYYFSLVNAAAFLGVLSILRGDRVRAWTPRSGIDRKGEPE